MTIEKAAVVGGGIIGSSWAIVYARAGCRVTIFDRRTAARESLRGRIADAMDQAAALIGDADRQADILERIMVADDLGAAVAEADFVHECVDEVLDSKAAVFRDLDALAKPSAILASTTSSFPVSSFAADLPGRHRCIVAHPATPPHLLPVTEICPAPFTDQQVTDDTFAFMRRCGQVPVLIRFERPSFVLNRMQAAMLVEMFRCLNDGIVSAADMDAIISQGFGLRWAFLGPFEGIDLGAAGGIREYLDRFGFITNAMAADLGLPGPVVTPASIAALEAYTRGALPLARIAERIAWRDRAIASLRALKAGLVDGDPAGPG